MDVLRQTILALQHKGNIFELRMRECKTSDVAQNLAKGHTLKFDFEMSSFNFGKIENVVYDLCEQFSIAADGADAV